MKKKRITPSKFSTLPERKKRFEYFLEELSKETYSDEKNNYIKKRLTDIALKDGIKGFDKTYKVFQDIENKYSPLLETNKNQLAFNEMIDSGLKE